MIPHIRFSMAYPIYGRDLGTLKSNAASLAGKLTENGTPAVVLDGSATKHIAITHRLEDIHPPSQLYNNRTVLTGMGYNLQTRLNAVNEALATASEAEKPPFREEVRTLLHSLQDYVWQRSVPLHLSQDDRLTALPPVTPDLTEIRPFVGSVKPVLAAEALVLPMRNGATAQ